MRKIVQFKHTTYENGTLYLHTDQADLLQGTTAAGQIIADSDRYAFVYLAENEEEYVYLYLEESIWDELKKALQEKNAVIAISDDYSLELDQFTEELDYLVTNIEGNGNYGDEMVKKVESVFLDK
ncbi:hypothetical protein F0342_06655 [Bacillus sp. CH30_1T]|uniref:UPF0738 family protein n=1 Tax=Bacillus sp. CH30_1T TaxID=2604836 RepID=UPI0011F00A05|nr:hypothetical protein [Bacillus sp. CH30_1T]KAA0565286.1 hypothetical protein F0342_06655 [Bacillus sp. CH30_1T]